MDTVQSLYREMQQRRTALRQQRAIDALARKRMVPRPAVQTLAEFEPAPPDWLWEPYLPGGMLAMLSGDPGSGTSYLALAIAAAVTRNAPVLYLSAENDPERVVRRRFDTLQGNPRQLHLLRAQLSGSGGEERSSPVHLSDLRLIEEAILQTWPRLLIIDPLQSHLGQAAGSPPGAASFLAALCRLSEKHHCCTLLVRHLSKNHTGRAAARSLGALDLTGTVRSELLAGSSPGDPGQRALIHVKSNVGPLGMALGYQIDAAGVFRWTGDSLLSVQGLLARDIPPEEKGALGEAVALLRTLLAHGCRPVVEVFAEARQAGIAPITLRRAKFLLQVESTRPGGVGPWYWQMQGQVLENPGLAPTASFPDSPDAGLGNLQ